MTRPLILSLIGISCLLFGSAVALPIFTLEPKAGEWTPLAQIISPSDMQAKAMRQLQGVGILWNEGERILALLIALFSLILPTLKLTMLWMEGLLSEGLPEKWALFLRAVSRYAMLEVFVAVNIGRRKEIGMEGRAFVAIVKPAVIVLRHAPLTPKESFFLDQLAVDELVPNARLGVVHPVVDAVE